MYVNVQCGSHRLTSFPWISACGWDLKTWQPWLVSRYLICVLTGNRKQTWTMVQHSKTCWCSTVPLRSTDMAVIQGQRFILLILHLNGKREISSGRARFSERHRSTSVLRHSVPAPEKMSSDLSASQRGCGRGLRSPLAFIEMRQRLSKCF